MIYPLTKSFEKWFKIFGRLDLSCCSQFTLRGALDLL
jgi:hypothetical protein